MTKASLSIPLFLSLSPLFFFPFFGNGHPSVTLNNLKIDQSKLLLLIFLKEIFQWCFFTISCYHIFLSLPLTPYKWNLLLLISSAGVCRRNQAWNSHPPVNAEYLLMLWSWRQIFMCGVTTQTWISKDICLLSRELKFSALLRLGQSKLCSRIFFNHQTSESRNRARIVVNPNLYQLQIV